MKRRDFLKATATVTVAPAALAVTATKPSLALSIDPAGTAPTVTSYTFITDERIELLGLPTPPTPSAIRDEMMQGWRIP